MVKHQITPNLELLCFKNCWIVQTHKDEEAEESMIHYYKQKNVLNLYISMTVFLSTNQADIKFSLREQYTIML